jgi:predicted DNA-binding protein (MmcQ/YjbR family)
LTKAEIYCYCLNKKKAYQDLPFGPSPVCFKVCGRIFAEVYSETDDFKMTLRCEPMLADYYRQTYPGVIVPGYHCPERQRLFKNTVYPDLGLTDEFIYMMIDHSYDQAVKSLRKKDRMELEKEEYNS